MAKFAISGQFREVVPIPEQGWYRYHLTEDKWYRYQGKVVSVPLTRTLLVPVLIQVVLVPLLPATLNFSMLTLLSSDLNTEGVGTLIND